MKILLFFMHSARGNQPGSKSENRCLNVWKGKLPVSVNTFQWPVKQKIRGACCKKIPLITEKTLTPFKSLGFWM